VRHRRQRVHRLSAGEDAAAEGIRCQDDRQGPWFDRFLLIFNEIVDAFISCQLVCVFFGLFVYEIRVYVFNRNGVCLLYREWHRPLRTLDPTQDHKLMFGLLFSLRSFTAKIDPTTAEKGNLGVPLLPGQGCSFYSFKTNTYKLNFMESPSGIKVNVAYFSFPTAFLTNLVRLIKVEGSFHLSKDSCVF